MGYEWCGHGFVVYMIYLSLCFHSLPSPPPCPPPPAPQIFSEPEKQNCLALLAFVSLLWATEAIPLFATSMLVAPLCVVLRVMVRPSSGEERGRQMISSLNPRALSQPLCCPVSPPCPLFLLNPLPPSSFPRWTVPMTLLCGCKLSRQLPPSSTPCSPRSVAGDGFVNRGACRRR